VQPQSLQELQLIYSQVETTMPDSPMLKGWNSYAQCDEDGIIRECLQRIARVSAPSKTFIEIGCGNGLENNSHQLLLDGYRGSWVDGDADNINHIESVLGQVDPKRLTVRREFITRDNIKQLITHFSDVLGTKEIDFFSLDTDGNDLVLVQDALSVISPKLICVEYNGKFPPPTRLVMDYNPTHNWAHDDYFGATLQSWVDGLPGYTLVSCNVSGVNAFFVRNDLLQEFGKYTVESIFQPARYWLIGIWGHVHSLKWLKQTLAAPAK
jgi:hypothetical protein